MLRVYSPRMSVWILKPSVGEMDEMSPPDMRFRMVVLPALSRPLGEETGCEGDTVYEC